MQYQKVRNNESHMALEISDTNHPCSWLKSGDDSGQAWVDFTQYIPGMGGNDELLIVTRQHSWKKGSRKVTRVQLSERSARALYHFLDAKFGSKP